MKLVPAGGSPQLQRALTHTEGKGSCIKGTYSTPTICRTATKYPTYRDCGKAGT